MNINNLADKIYNGVSIVFYTNEQDIFGSYKLQVTRQYKGNYEFKYNDNFAQSYDLTFETLQSKIADFKPYDYTIINPKTCEV